MGRILSFAALVCSTFFVLSETASLKPACYFTFNCHKDGVDCVDDNSECAESAGKGECETYSDYMLIFCQKSCKVCQGESKAKVRVECVTGNGEDYRGTVDTDSNGNKCQAWSSQTPNKHKSPVGDPEYGLEENYCRNADGADSPWCYNSEGTSPRWSYCSVPKCKDVRVECVTGNGADYRGTVDTDSNGNKCQAWSSQTPNGHKSPVGDPEYGLEENYCRNADGADSPWCYNSEGTSPRWSYCSVPKC